MSTTQSLSNLLTSIQFPSVEELAQLKNTTSRTQFHTLLAKHVSGKSDNGLNRLPLISRENEDRREEISALVLECLQYGKDQGFIQTADDKARAVALLHRLEKHVDTKAYRAVSYIGRSAVNNCPSIDVVAIKNKATDRYNKITRGQVAVVAAGGTAVVATVFVGYSIYNGNASRLASYTGDSIKSGWSSAGDAVSRGWSCVADSTVGNTVAYGWSGVTSRVGSFVTTYIWSSAAPAPTPAPIKIPTTAP